MIGVTGLVTSLRQECYDLKINAANKCNNSRKRKWCHLMTFFFIETSSKGQTWKEINTTILGNWRWCIFMNEMNALGYKHHPIKYKYHLLPNCHWNNNNWTPSLLLSLNLSQKLWRKYVLETSHRHGWNLAMCNSCFWI